MTRDDLRRLARRDILRLTAAAALAPRAILAAGDAPPNRKRMMYADESRGRPFAKDPAVVRFAGAYFLYYSIPPHKGSGDKRWGIGIARGDDLVNWKRVGEFAPADGPEEKGLAAPGAFVRDGRVHLFYQTYGNGPKDALCHAVSDDAVAFTRDKTNPIFRPAGDWTCGRAIDADVIEHDGRLLLYFATRDPAFKVQMLGVAGAPIGSDYSRDAWKQLRDGPILRPELPWEQDCIEAPAAFRRDGKLWMFYAGAYNNKPQQIGCAFSADGLDWRRLAKEPFLPAGGPGEWNSSESGHPFAFSDDDGRLYLFFQGNDDKGKTWRLSQREVLWRDGRPHLAT